jgi:hypothetical protein
VSDVIFWRPLSREIYFSVLYSFGTAGPFVGHSLNAILLVATTLMLGSLAAKLAGRWAGVFAGLAFAFFSQTPMLVAWLSCIQDLLAMVFMLAAMHLRLARRHVLAAAALVLALLSKETSFAIVPLLVFLDWVLRRRPYQLARGLITYGGLGLVWAVTHPGIRILFDTGMQRSPGGYIGLENPNRLASLWKSLVTLANLPVSGLRTTWPSGQWLWLLAAFALAVLALWRWGSAEPQGEPQGSGQSRRGILVLGLLLCALPLAPTTILVSGWAPYYTIIPFVGLALVLGGVVSMFTRPVAIAAAAALLLLGCWSRNATLDPGLPTVRNLAPAANALKVVERGFKALRPSFPPGSDVYVSVQAFGAASVKVHLYWFQVLRVWYGDPTLSTIRPDRRRVHHGPEFLFWVTPKFGVFEIDPVTFAHRPSGDAGNYLEFMKTLRYYARGLAATGEIERAASTLLSLTGQEPVVRNVDARTAAMLLLAAGKGDDGRLVLGKVPPLPRELQLAGIGAVLKFSAPEQVLDDYAFEAFEVSPSDIDALRKLAREFRRDGRPDLAARFGHRLLALRPGDGEAQSWVERYKRTGPLERITVRMFGDTLPGDLGFTLEAPSAEK